MGKIFRNNLYNKKLKIQIGFSFLFSFHNDIKSIVHRTISTCNIYFNFDSTMEIAKNICN